MPGNVNPGDALYMAWRFDAADGCSAGRMQDLLTRGERQKLYRLISWVVVDGEVRALLEPAAPLEQIAAVVWKGSTKQVASRWIASESACAAVTREIEISPVALGLAMRPEQWPYSSAAHG